MGSASRFGRSWSPTRLLRSARPSNSRLRKSPTAGTGTIVGVGNVVARIYDPGRSEVYQRLGIPTVATVRWTADQVLRRLTPHGAEPEWRDPTGGVVLAEVHVGDPWIGRSPRELEAASNARI